MASAHILQCLKIGILLLVKIVNGVFCTEENRQVVIFLLRSANYDNVNAVSKSGQIINISREVSQELINLFTSSFF